MKNLFYQILNIIGVQNQLLITFCSDIMCNKTCIKGYTIDPLTHELLNFDIILHIKIEQNVIRK